MNFEVLDNDQVLKICVIETPSGKKHVVKEPYDMKYHAKLTIDKPSILADGLDKATITATVYNYLNEPQSDWAGDITFVVDGIQELIATTNGVTSTTFDSEVVGEFAIKTSIPNFRNGEVKVVAE